MAFLSLAAFTAYLGVWQVRRKGWKEQSAPVHPHPPSGSDQPRTDLTPITIRAFLCRVIAARTAALTGNAVPLADLIQQQSAHTHHHSPSVAPLHTLVSHPPSLSCLTQWQRLHRSPRVPARLPHRSARLRPSTAPRPALGPSSAGAGHRAQRTGLLPAHSPPAQRWQHHHAQPRLGRPQHTQRRSTPRNSPGESIPPPPSPIPSTPLSSTPLHPTLTSFLSTSSPTLPPCVGRRRTAGGCHPPPRASTDLPRRLRPADHRLLPVPGPRRHLPAPAPAHVDAGAGRRPLPLTLHYPPPAIDCDVPDLHHHPPHPHRLRRHVVLTQCGHSHRHSAALPHAAREGEGTTAEVAMVCVWGTERHDII